MSEQSPTNVGDARGSSVRWVLPTLHPAFLVRGGWAWRGIVAGDLAKALQLAQGGGSGEEEVRYSRGEHEEGGEEGGEEPHLGPVNFLAARGGDGDSPGECDDGPLAIDIECTRAAHPRITQINFGWDGGAGVWRPPSQRDGGVESEDWLFVRQLSGSARLKIFHNAQFDVPILEDHQAKVGGPIYDTMIAAAILEPDLPNDLEFVAKQYANFKPWKHLAQDDLARYGMLDAGATYAVYKVTQEELRREGVWGCFETSMEVLPLLLEMRQRGLRINRRRMEEEAARCRGVEEAAEAELNWMVQGLQPRQARTEDLHGALSAVWREAEEATGRARISLRKRSRELIAELHECVLPNWASQKQLLKVLDELGLGRRMKDGKVTTDAAALQELGRQTGNPVLRRLLDLRAAQKLRSTYFEHDTASGGTIHPTYLLHRDYDVEGGVAGACSGRLASKDPNIQNWPKGARCIVEPDEDGWEVMVADYEQIEWRIIAWKTGGRLWEDVNRPGFDIHREVAARVYKVGVEAVSWEQREEGKRCVYAGAYGVGPLTLSRRLAAKGLFISVADCKRFIGAFKGMYPEVAQTQQGWVDEAVATNKVTNPFGRYRRFYRPYEEVTQIYNIFPQSTAGDIILRAMGRLHRELPAPARIAIQVHDDLVFFYPRELREQVKERVLDIMPARVPEMPGFSVAVKLRFGVNWGELHEEGHAKAVHIL